MFFLFGCSFEFVQQISSCDHRKRFVNDEGELQICLHQARSIGNFQLCLSIPSVLWLWRYEWRGGNRFCRRNFVDAWMLCTAYCSNRSDRLQIFELWVWLGKITHTCRWWAVHWTWRGATCVVNAVQHFLRSFHRWWATIILRGRTGFGLFNNSLAQHSTRKFRILDSFWFWFLDHIFTLTWASLTCRSTQIVWFVLRFTFIVWARRCRLVLFYMSLWSLVSMQRRWFVQISLWWRRTVIARCRWHFRWRTQYCILDRCLFSIRTENVFEYD